MIFFRKKKKKKKRKKNSRLNAIVKRSSQRCSRRPKDQLSSIPLAITKQKKIKKKGPPCPANKVKGPPAYRKLQKE